MEELCSVEPCTRPVFARSWCSAHYTRWTKYGDVRADVPVGGTPAPASCELAGCQGPHYSGGLCEMHYRRRLRTGEVRAEDPKHGTAEAAPCSVPSCPHPSEARGWCHGHYLRWRRNGDVNAGEPLSRRKQPQTCTVDGCGRDSYSRGICRPHYKRLLKHGDVQADVPIRKPTGEGWINHGYRNVSVPPDLRHLSNGDAKIGEHRLVMAQQLGRPLFPDESVHHKNGVRTDNRLSNLELWSSAHPKGQRVEEKVEFALEILLRYGPQHLRDGSPETR